MGALTGVWAINRRGSGQPGLFAGPDFHIPGSPGGPTVTIRSRAAFGTWTQTIRVARIDNPLVRRELERIWGLDRVTGNPYAEAFPWSPRWRRTFELLDDPLRADRYEQVIPGSTFFRAGGLVNVPTRRFGTVPLEGSIEQWFQDGGADGSTATVNGRPWAACEGVLRRGPTLRHRPEAVPWQPPGEAELGAGRPRFRGWLVPRWFR
jgi:hypothetical protein